jgi:hypothetical protein
MKSNQLITFREIFIVNFARLAKIISRDCDKIQTLRKLEQVVSIVTAFCKPLIL